LQWAQTGVYLHCVTWWYGGVERPEIAL